MVVIQLNRLSTLPERGTLMQHNRRMLCQDIYQKLGKYQNTIGQKAARFQAV